MSILGDFRNRLALWWGGHIASALQPYSAKESALTIGIWLALVWSGIFFLAFWGVRPLAITWDFARYLLLNLFVISIAGGGAALVAKRMAAYLLSEVMLMRMFAWYRNPRDEYGQAILSEISETCQDPIPMVQEFFLYRERWGLGGQEVISQDWRSGPLYDVIRCRIERRD